MPLARLARETDVGLRTLERWHARYRADGYAGLETASRADAGSRRLPPDLVDLIEGLALSKPRPAIATIHRKVTGICAARRWPVPSYSVVWDIVRTLDPGMVTLALEGAASYRDKHELVLRRQAELPNAMWQSDHEASGRGDLVAGLIFADGQPGRQVDGDKLRHPAAGQHPSDTCRPPCRRGLRALEPFRCPTRP